MLKLRRLAVASAVMGVSVCLAAMPAHAVHVGCGDVITQDTTLDSDLLNCTSDGIVIGAPGITLDLGGHLIDGPNPAPVAGAVNTPAGVHNRESHDDVTVQNGRITEFATGVIAASQFADGPAERIVLRRLDITSNLGIAADRATHSMIEANRVLSRTRAILLFDSSYVVVRANSVDSVPPLRFAASIDALTFGDRSHHNVIERNTLDHGGIAITGHDEVATRNDLGVDSHIIVNGARQLVSRNVIVGGAGVGVASAAQGLAAEVYKNEIARSRGDGIIVLFGQAHIDHNTVTESAGNGIRVGTSSSLVERNRAYLNAGLGIFAAQGVVDGGQNRAAGNGDPAQCVGVSCK